MSEKRARLKKLIEGKRIIVAPGVFDCLGARIVENIGFDAIYLTGFGTSASLLGRPDLGFLTLNELAAHAKNRATGHGPSQFLKHKSPITNPDTGCQYKFRPAREMEKGDSWTKRLIMRH